MEQRIDMEALRKQLQAIPHKEFISLAARAGLRLSTVLKIRSGYTPDPRISNVEALVKALQGQGPTKPRKAQKARA